MTLFDHKDKTIVYLDKNEKTGQMVFEFTPDLEQVTRLLGQFMSENPQFAQAVMSAIFNVAMYGIEQYQTNKKLLIPNVKE